MKIIIILFWCTYITSQTLCLGKLLHVSRIPRIGLQSSVGKIAHVSKVDSVKAYARTISNTLSLRGGAKSPLYLFYRKVSRSLCAVLQPYLPISWLKQNTLGDDSSREGRYGKLKKQKADKKPLHDNITGSRPSCASKHNRLQKVLLFAE